MFLPILQRLMALASLVLIAVSAYLLWTWWRLHELAQAAPPGVVVDTEDWRLWVGGALMVWSLLGRMPMGLLLGRGAKNKGWLARGEAIEVETPDGAKLAAERTGPADAPVIVMVHGWGMERRTWNGVRAMLAKRYEVLSFDLAGLGQSSPPGDREHTVERMTDHLLPVLDLAGRRKVVLVGHSIGGMIVQTFCVRHAERARSQVAGIVLCNTTHEDPTRTMIAAPLWQVLKPLLKAAMWLDVALEPLFWAMNWQSYLSGSTHMAMRLGGFGTRPTRNELELVSRDATVNRPAVQAKGNLAMMRWGVTDELPRIDRPALVFTGGRDIVTLPSAGYEISRRLQNATLRPMPEAGHLGPMELARSYGKEIAAFADQVLTAGAIAADRRPAEGAAAAKPPSPEPRPGAVDGVSAPPSKDPR